MARAPSHSVQIWIGLGLGLVLALAELLALALACLRCWEALLVLLCLRCWDKLLLQRCWQKLLLLLLLPAASKVGAVEVGAALAPGAWSAQAAASAVLLTLTSSSGQLTAEPRPASAPGWTAAVS